MYVIQREQEDGSFADLADVKPVPVYLGQEEFVIHYIPSFNARAVVPGDTVRANDIIYVVQSIEVLSPSVLKLIVTKGENMPQSDPRPDKTGNNPIPHPGNNPTHPAPGGVGTGTKGAPEGKPSK